MTQMENEQSEIIQFILDLNKNLENITNKTRSWHKNRGDITKSSGEKYETNT